MDPLDNLIEKLKTLSPESIGQLNTFVNYLQWQEQYVSGKAKGAMWSYDFIEHFAEAEKSPQHDEQGAEIKIGMAVSDGVEKPAVFAHPPVQGRSVVEFYVPIPQDIETLKLKLAIGIRDGAKLAGSNLVAFSVQMNGYRIWGTQTNLRRWQEFELPLTAQVGDINQIAFVTEALGNHQWTWAAWGSPVIEGMKNGVSI